LFRWRRKDNDSPTDRRLLLLAFVGIFLAIGVSAPTGYRLYHVAVPGLVIFVWLCERSRYLTRIMPIGLILLGLIGAAYVVQRQTTSKQFLDMPAGRAAFLSEATFEKYAWIGENTRPSESFYEARHPNFYFPFYLKNPTPFYMVRNSGYTPAFQVDAAVAALERERPRLIIWQKNWSKPLEMRPPTDSLEPLSQFIKNNYEIKHIFDESKAGFGFDNAGDTQVWELIATSQTFPSR
jgi:hypothetical protein